MPTPEPSDAVLQTQRVLPFSAQAIYAAFSDPAQLAQWWGPQGFRNTFDVFEFRQGGRWDFVMHGPEGHDYANRCVFAELVEGQTVVIDHVNAPLFRLTVTLEPQGDKTCVSWVQRFEDPQVAQAVRHIAEPGNEQNLDRLHQLLSQRA